MPVLGLFRYGEMISRPYAGCHDPNSGVMTLSAANPVSLSLGAAAGCEAARQGRSALLNCGG